MQGWAYGAVTFSIKHLYHDISLTGTSRQWDNPAKTDVWMFFSDVTTSKVSHLLIVEGGKVSCQRRVVNQVEVRENLKSSKNSVTDKGDRERRGGKRSGVQ